MFDYDRWQEIYHSLKKHKLRTTLTAFGVMWGIFMLVVLMGAGNGLRNGVMQDFDIARNAVFVWSERTSLPYKGLPTGRFIQLNNADVEAIRNGVPGIEVIAPRLSVRGSFTVVRRDKSVAFTVFGDYPQFTEIRPVRLDGGRFINHRDIERRRKVAVIGSRVKEVLFTPDENPIGQYIQIKGVHFLVVGTFFSPYKGESAVEDAQTIYIPLTALQATFNQMNDIGWLSFIPQPGVPAALIETRVRQVLAEQHMVHPDDPAAFGSFNVEKEYQKVQGLFAGIRALSWLVSVMTIIAGMVGVGNIMLIIVKERTKEIGIRKSLGATPGSIISMVVLEALIITGAAGYAGLLLGVAFVKLINDLLVHLNAESPFFANPEINFEVAATAILVLVISGVLAGFFPARHAAHVNPAIGLRAE